MARRRDPCRTAGQQRPEPRHRPRPAADRGADRGAGSGPCRRGREPGGAHPARPALLAGPPRHRPADRP